MPRQASKRNRAAGKSLRFWAANPAGIAIQSDTCGSTILRQRTGQRLQRRFSGEIGAHMCIEEYGGAGVDDVERFDHMLPLALGISGYTGDVFEIHLPGTHRAGSFQGLMLALCRRGNALMSLQYAVNGLARWDRQLKKLHPWIAF